MRPDEGGPPDRSDDGDRGAGRDRPDVQRVGDLDDAQRAALVKKRRITRRLKALAAVGLALAAGTFVACSRAVMGGDGGDATTGGEAGPELDAGADGGMDASLDIDAEQPDAGATVDAEMFYDGMPVPDNLLE